MSKKKDEQAVMTNRLVHQMSQRLRRAGEKKVFMIVLSKNDVKRLKSWINDTSDTDALSFRGKSIRVSPNANDGDPICVMYENGEA